MGTLQELLSKDIPFAVIVSQNTFKLKGVHDISKDYHVIIAEKDADKVESVFHICRHQDGVMERELNDSEIELFKQQSLYTKVVHNEHGRVYELKTKPFKQYFLS